MAYELTGKIKLIQEPKTFDSGFTKREMVVIVEDGRYPQEINLEFVQDKVSLLDALQPGQEVTVTFHLLQNRRRPAARPKGVHDPHHPSPRQT